MTQQQTAPDAMDVLMGSSRATAKFKTPGDTTGGRIVSAPKAHPEREYDRNNPGGGRVKTFPSGDVIYGITVDVATNLRDPSISDDDGVRRIFVEGKRMKETVRDAVRTAGAERLEVGGELYVTYTGDGQAAGDNINPPKEYAARYVPPAQAAVMGGQQQPQAQLPPQGYQQPATQQPMIQQPQAQPAQQPMQQQPQYVATPQGQVNTQTGELQQPAVQAQPAQQQPSATGPTPEQIAAVKAAGLDPAQVFGPGF